MDGEGYAFFYWHRWMYPLDVDCDGTGKCRDFWELREYDDPGDAATAHLKE